MTRHLLDTNIVSDLLRNPHGPIAERIRTVGEAQVCTSIVVAAELRFGAAKSGSRRLGDQVEAVLDAMEVIPLEKPADIIYGEIRRRLEQIGQPIGANDLLIAAQAVALDYTLVSDDRAFARVEGLQLENWRRTPA